MKLKKEWNKLVFFFDGLVTVLRIVWIGITVLTIVWIGIFTFVFIFVEFCDLLIVLFGYLAV